MSQRKNTSQQVRIIGGKYKGRKLRFKGDQTLRPTLGRTRETLFNWLRPHLPGSQVLDAFAGSGALGFEALSHGAAQITLLESNPHTHKSLVAGASDLGVDNQCHILRTDTNSYLRQCTSAFDIIFLDPPFNAPELLTQTLEVLLQHKQARHLIYAEARTLFLLTDLAENFDLSLTKHTKSGDTVSGLFELNN